MELIPCINCVSVVDEGDLEVSKSLGDAFLKKIGSGSTYFDFLYKTYWLSWGVNFLTLDDTLKVSGSSSSFSIGEVYKDG